MSRSPMTTAPTFRLGAMVAMVAMVVMVVFLPVLGNDWVVNDDVNNFLANPHYRGLGAEQIRWAFTTIHMAVYQPFCWILYEAEYVAFGLRPAGYHLVSLALHAVNAVTFMALTAAILGRCPSMTDAGRRQPIQWSAAAAAVLYAIHPLRAEVVAWTSAQGYLPSALFAKLATLAYLRCDRAARWHRVALLALCWILYVVAMLFKVAALALPAAWLVLDAFPLRRFSAAGTSRGREILKALAEKIPFAAAAVFFLGAGYFAKYILDPEAAREGSPADQFGRACYTASYYVMKTAWPTGLAVLYDWQTAARSPDPRFVAGFLACVALTALAVGFGRRWPGALAAWCAYLALLAPTSNLVRSIKGLVTDRYSYIPTMPLYIASAYAFARLLAGPRRWADATIAALATAMLALGCVTWRQCLTWRDTEALIGHAVEVGAISGDRYLILLGDYRERQNRIDEAERCYREAVRSAPDSPAAADALGSFLARRGDPEAGFPWFERSIALDPRFVQGYNNVGVVLLRRGRLSEAARQFETAVRIHPFYLDARYNLARTLHRMGRLAEAAENYALVLQGDPRHRRALAGLAELARGAAPVDRDPGTSGQFARP